MWINAQHSWINAQPGRLCSWGWQIVCCLFQRSLLRGTAAHPPGQQPPQDTGNEVWESISYCAHRSLCCGGQTMLHCSLESVCTMGLEMFAHGHFPVWVDRGGVAKFVKFVSKANFFMPLQVLAMLNSTYPAERRDLCFVFNPIGKKKILRQSVISFYLLNYENTKVLKGPQKLLTLSLSTSKFSPCNIV